MASEPTKAIIHLEFAIPPDLNDEACERIAAQIARLIGALDALHKHYGGSGLRATINGEEVR